MQTREPDMTNPTYFDKYENLAFRRDDDGVLVLRFHTNGGPVGLHWANASRSPGRP